MKLGGLLVAVVVTAGAVFFATGAASGSRSVVLHVTLPTSDGTVIVSPGGHRCASRCTFRFARGAVVRARAAPGTDRRLERWSGACTGATRCTFKMTRARSLVARFALYLTSWNPHVECTPTLTTLPELVGSQEGPTHGALESAGKFQPHLAGGAQRHLLDPPCRLQGEGTFVQIDGVVVSTDWSPSVDGDYTGSLYDPSRPDIPNAYLKTVHAELDGTWFAAEVAPLRPPAAGTKIDVQGFVYWDPGHVSDGWHSHSGWELHPLSDWRPAGGGPLAPRRYLDVLPAKILRAPNAPPRHEDEGDG